MSQENEFNKSEVIEDDIVDEVEDNEEDLQEEDQDDPEGVDWQARALKAEGAIVKRKQNSKKKTNNKQDNQIDLLRFNGVTSDEIEKLKKIAVMEDMDLIDARNSEYFTIWKDKQAKEAISKQATVGASKRGRSVTENLEQVRKRIMEGKGTQEDLKRVRDGK